MSKLSYRLSMAVTGGRAPLDLTRERILANLLRKRAAAHSAGLDAREGALREQIRWSLPIRKGEPADT
jgi:hypothetical protein